ncbi:transposase [Actinomadura sp. NAK00032]|uniref:transposase n=1 Tax=Actinomadura sp. NAK00032 TaxID=2742128 RepID=UPI001C37C779|nr:transposase [Actinomadura sp. NAK00032]
MAEPAAGLRPVYPVIFLDAIQVEIRDAQVANRPIHVALAVTVEGTRDILGLWAGDGGGEGAKYWLQVLTELRNRGRGRRLHGGVRRTDRPAPTPSPTSGRRPLCRRASAS